MTKATITAILTTTAIACPAAMLAQQTAPVAIVNVEAQAAQDALVADSGACALSYSAEARTSVPGPLLSLPQQVAAKALAGVFGPLAGWQQTGYKRLLKHGARRRVAWITHYWTGEPGVDTCTASGRRVERGRTAAMLEPRSGMPWGTYVLVDLPSGYTLRQVFDTGSKRNRGRAERRGAETWIDLFVTGRTSRTCVRPIWIEVR